MASTQHEHDRPHPQCEHEQYAGYEAEAGDDTGMPLVERLHRAHLHIAEYRVKSPE
jgi:hypothetical protein